MIPKVAAILRAIPIIFIAAGILPAQDASISPVAFFKADGAPDQLPQPTRKIYPRIPEELRNAPDPGYVVIICFVDSRGKILTMRKYSSVRAYERSVTVEEGVSLDQDGWRFKPAKRAGVAVNSVIRFAVVFNPASASPSARDATPRLLDASVAVVRDWKTGQDADPNTHEVVWGTVHVDENGNAAAVTDVPERYRSLLNESVLTWRFAPARKAGRPVAEDLHVPFIVIPGDISVAGDSVPPRVRSQRPPEYPIAMRESGMRGEVVVGFTVDIEGRVVNAHVVKSLNPAFDEPSLVAVRGWTFDPATNGGIPLNMDVQVPLFFSLTGVPGGGSDAFSIEKSKNRSELPEDLRVDVEPRVTNIASPVYPYALLRDRIKGSSSVVFIVDRHGKVSQSQVRSASRPEFGLALAAAIERYEYEPAIKAGHPNKSLLRFDQDFSQSDDSIVAYEDLRLMKLEQTHPERIIADPSRLDVPLKAVVTRPPVYPRSLTDRTVRGVATVEFLVDENGHPRLPRIISASEPAFGYAAVQAVSLWEFTRPRVGEKEVVARTRVPFEFEPMIAPKPQDFSR